MFKQPAPDRDHQYTEYRAVAGGWLIYFDRYRDKTYGAVRTTDFKNFINISDQVKLPDGHKHGTIVGVSRNVVRVLRAMTPANQ